MADEALLLVDEKDALAHLLEPTYPLLQKFRELCPGSFKHSQSLVSIVEGLSMALGLNVLKMKVAAQYHDIGKIFNPKIFAENQLEEDDVHDKLSPTISYNLITRHVSDSVLLLINDSLFPRDIIEMISQHHGKSILRYFFDKSDSDIEDMFRYKTMKPICIEAAILMICDQIEAMSRSLIQANKYDAKMIVETTINGLLDDGQLDEVHMRLGDLKIIKEALLKEMEGTYQKRPDYDEAKKKKNGNGNETL